MQYRALHSKVHVWWTSWWAVQFTGSVGEFPCGIHIEWRRPLLDIYFWRWTIAFGKHPVLTDPRMSKRHSCRGFIIDEDAFRAMIF